MDEDTKKLIELIEETISAIDTEMELGDYHFDDTFASDEARTNYEDSVDDVVRLRVSLREHIAHMRNKNR